MSETREPTDYFGLSYGRGPRTDADFTEVMQQYAREHMQIDICPFDGTRSFKWSHVQPTLQNVARYDALHPDTPFHTILHPAPTTESR